MSLEQPLALVIEDDLDAAFIFSTAMTENGYRVESIHDGAKAATYLQTVTPVVILLDLHLPNVGGSELLRQVRAAKHLEATKVVLITADPRTAENVEKDADLVLLKPVTFSQVRDLVKRIMRPTTNTKAYTAEKQDESTEQPPAATMGA